MRNTHASTIGLLVLLLGGCASLPDDGHSVTPQRPTLSSDTGTAAAGTLELEFGATLDPGDSASLPASIKYGLDESTEVFLNFSPFDYVELPGRDGKGFGDTFLGLRHRFWESAQAHSAAFQLAAKFPTADASDGLGSGELDVYAAGILTHEFDEETVLTGFYELGVLGDPEASGTELQHAVALAASRSLPGHVGVFGELSQVYGPDDVDPVVAILGATRAVNPSLAFDVGVALGLNDDAPDAQLLFGFTTNFGRIGRR